MIVHALANHPALQTGEHGHRAYLGVSVPSPATLKSMGHEILRQSGYPIAGERREAWSIWDLVKSQPHLLGITELYQDRVVRLVGMNNLAFQMQPDVTRIEEWQLPHADIGDEPHSGTGYCSIDGFELGPCMLIEAKLGFGGYLKDVYNLRPPKERGTRVPSSNAMPQVATEVTQCTKRARIPMQQLLNLILGGRINGIGRQCGQTGFNALRVDIEEIRCRIS